MVMPHPICLLMSIINGLRGLFVAGAPITGHRCREAERLNHCIVTVLQCERCGVYHVGWERTAQSTHEPYPDERKHK